MLKYNQTGPSGRGPMTGRGRGLCYNVGPEYATGIPDNGGFGPGMGFGRGFQGGTDPEMRVYRGRGLGRKRAPFMEAYPEDSHVEMDKLKIQVESMKGALDAIKQRLSGIGKSE